MWQPEREGSLGENRYMYMCGWVLHCLPETITALLIGYTPRQHRKFKKTIMMLKIVLQWIVYG